MAYALFKKFNIPVPDLSQILAPMPDVSLCEKGGQAGGMITLLLKGAQDLYWVLGCKSWATFGKALPDMPDCFYAASTQTLQEKEGKFLISRIGDMAHTFVLKVELEGPADLDTLFQSVSMSTGEFQFVDIDLQTNNALAKAYGLWPGKNNDAPRQEGQRWVATIPIVFRETTAYTKIVKPLVAVYYYETEVKLNMIMNKNAKFVLDVDYVYLDHAARTWLANDGNSEAKKPDEPAPASCPDAWDTKPKDEWDKREATDDACEVKSKTDTDKLLRETCPDVPTYREVIPTGTLPKHPLSGKRSFFVTQYQTTHAFLTPGLGKTRRFSLRTNHPTCGWLITLSPEDPAIKQTKGCVAPILGASIDFNGHCAMEFDFADLTEWNWIKCDMKVPTDFCTLLLPVSREMFWGDKSGNDAIVCPCTINLSRLDSCMLTLDVNEEILDLCGWNVGITSISNNISVYGRGKEDLRFAP